MLLLLAGTGESRQIAEALRDEKIPVIASLSGATRGPQELPVPTRRGGFGGADGFEGFLDEFGITAILDATHPFAWRISTRTAHIAARRNLPHLQLLRPAWQPGVGDDWTMLEYEEEAREHIPPGARVFLATGRQTLPRFANLKDRYLVCRQIDPPDGPFPFPNGEYLVGRPPFSVEDEVQLFRKLKINWLVVKNAGGAASATKLTAARQLGIPVAMIARPTQPETPRVETVEEALDWVRKL